MANLIEGNKDTPAGLGNLALLRAVAPEYDSNLQHLRGRIEEITDPVFKDFCLAANFAVETGLDKPANFSSSLSFKLLRRGDRVIERSDEASVDDYDIRSVKRSHMLALRREKGIRLEKYHESFQSQQEQRANTELTINFLDGLGIGKVALSWFSLFPQTLKGLTRDRNVGNFLAKYYLFSDYAHGQDSEPVGVINGEDVSRSSLTLDFRGKPLALLTQEATLVRFLRWGVNEMGVRPDGPESLRSRLIFDSSSNMFIRDYDNEKQRQIIEGISGAINIVLGNQSFPHFRQRPQLDSPTLTTDGFLSLLQGVLGLTGNLSSQ